MATRETQALRAEDQLVDALRRHLHPLAGTPGDHDELLRLIGAARFALLGEASHGTREFYRERISITRRLIVEKGFTAVAVEADWPDAWRVNRYVRGLPGDADAAQALSGFQRFPAWMWRNTEVRDFVEWLREYNRDRGREQQVGFYGIDLYSLFTSIQAVLEYLDRTDPDAARRARARYACFDHAHEDSQAYGYGASYGLTPSCEDEVIQQLRDMNRRFAETARPAPDWSATKPSTRSRTRAWSTTPRSTTARCSAAGSRHGTCATATWCRRSRRWTATSARPARPRASRYGRTTRTWATHRPPRWATWANGTWAS